VSTAAHAASVKARPPRYSSARSERSWTLWLINSLLAGVERTGLFRVRLDVDRLQREVRQEVGLDWRDRHYEEPMRVMANAINNEADMHPAGRFMMILGVKLFLKNRLLLEQAWQNQPEAMAMPVRRPLYVIGLPRTGTTLLYNLLCQDPNCRPLMGWESFFPVPEPALRGRKQPPDVRRQEGDELVARVNRMAPRLKSVHELVSDGPEECTWLLNNTFLSPGMVLQAKVLSYLEYLKSQPRAAWQRAYTDYANSLKLLQHNSPGTHWVLKSPAHQMGLGPLLDVIPQACVVQTHRDVTKVIGSCCSLFSVVRGIYSDKVCEETLGPEVVDHLRFATARAMEARSERPAQIFDVGFEHLVKDPIGTVRRIYERFGYEYDPRMEAGMVQWLRDNPQGKHGSHKYDLAQFGLTEQHVRDAFADYQSLCDEILRPTSPN